MEFLIHLIVVALVLGLLFWLVTYVAGLLPPPIGNVVRIIATVVLVLALISFLLGESGVWAGWTGYGHYRRW